MKLDLKLSEESSLLVAQRCRQLKLSPEQLVEQLICALLRSPTFDGATLQAILSDKLRTLEKTHQTLKNLSLLQQKIQNLLP